MPLRSLIGDLLRGRRAQGKSAQADALYERALECRARSDVSGARAAGEQALALSPGHARSHHLLGVIHAQGGDLQRSLRHLEQAVAHAPGWADAHLGHGNARQLAGDVRAAEESYKTAVALAPDAAAAHYSLGVLLGRSGRKESALLHFARAHELDAAAGEIAWELVKLLLDAGEYERARAAAQETLARNAGSAAARKALGLALLHLNEPQLALAEFGEATVLAPGDDESWLHAGIALQELGRLDEALAAYERALELEPNHPSARWRRALIRLTKGEFERGWGDYEARLASGSHPWRRFPQPLWQGDPLAGKVLLVHAEQGLGDEIMFASCLPELVAQAGHCVIDCHPRLATLFRRSFPAATVHGALQTDDLSWLTQCPPADYQVPAGSVPRILRSRAEHFPSHAGYLRADAQRTAEWKARLAGLGEGLKVGLSWQGGTRLSRAHLRSLSLDRLLPVLRVAGVRFVNLQYTDSASERARLAQASGIEVVHWQEAIADYDETAALVAALDLTLSVCTALVHLAGALGKRAWVLTPFSPEWRYGHAGTRMAWYPEVRLFRQARYGDWDPVIAAVAEQLRHCADAGDPDAVAARREDEGERRKW